MTVAFLVFCRILPETNARRPGLLARQADAAHDACDALVIDALARLTKLGGDPRDAVGAGRFPVHGPYPDGQAGVGRLPRCPVRSGRTPVVETGAGDAHDGAQPLHAVAALVVGDELEAVHQRVAPAKYFAAFRRISRSSSSSRTFFRRAAFSSSSGVGGSAGACARRPRGRLAPAARTQLHRVSGLIPRSAATCPIVASGRDWYSATASALNYGG